MCGVPTMCQAYAGATRVRKTKSPVVTSTPSSGQTQTVDVYQFSLWFSAKYIWRLKVDHSCCPHPDTLN